MNVKDIVLTKKQPHSDRSSPYFSETASINSTPTIDDLYQEMNALKLTASVAADLRQHHPVDTMGAMGGYDYLHSVLGAEGGIELPNGVIE